ncbi:hypothetical protein ACJIZ3_008678 [Penstemon smallii]|uniref:ZF-HD dimerization-type domain-containing protein n=1 Tax=Penstemon smallii TaxID=265156 RepID=A0ABD3TAF2_9LAMI
MVTNVRLHIAKVKIFVTYKDCLHNQAAKAMGYALDGCDPVVANDPDGTKESLVCDRVEADLPGSNKPQSHLPKHIYFTLSPLSHPQPQYYQQNSTIHGPIFNPSERTCAQGVHRDT